MDYDILENVLNEAAGDVASMYEALREAENARDVSKGLLGNAEIRVLQLGTELTAALDKVRVLELDATEDDILIEDLGKEILRLKALVPPPPPGPKVISVWDLSGGRLPADVTFQLAGKPENILWMLGGTGFRAMPEDGRTEIGIKNPAMKTVIPEPMGVRRIYRMRFKTDSAKLPHKVNLCQWWQRNGSPPVLALELTQDRLRLAQTVEPPDGPGRRYVFDTAVQRGVWYTVEVGVMWTPAAGTSVTADLRGDGTAQGWALPGPTAYPIATGPQFKAGAYLPAYLPNTGYTGPEFINQISKVEVLEP